MKILMCKRGYTKEQRRNYHQRYYGTLRGHLRRVYTHFNNRCNNPKDGRYKDWGGRGIENRFASFDDFYDYIIVELNLKHIEQVKGFVIDRVNNEGHYEEGNLRFVTPAESNKNRRKTYKQRFSYDL